MSARKRTKRYSKRYDRTIRDNAALQGMTMQKLTRQRIKTKDNKISNEKFDAIAQQLINENPEFFRNLADK